MSAKDAPSEVNEKSHPNFDGSPNITSAVDEEQQAIDAAEAAKKQEETTQIDGVPIDEKDIKYKASDIKKKGKAEYFVNVEDAEERKKEATEVKRRNEAEDNRVIGELKKKATEVKRRNKAEDNRVIGELMKKASTRKKEYRDIKRRDFIKRHKKAIIIAIILVVVAIIAVIYAVSYMRQHYIDTRIKEATAEANKILVEGTEQLKNDTSDTSEDNLISYYEEKLLDSKDEYSKQRIYLAYAQSMMDDVKRYDLSISVLDRLTDEFPEYKTNCDAAYLYRANYLWIGDGESADKFNDIIINKCSEGQEDIEL